jgi:cytochrome c-type biogenesis protein CcmE
VENSYFVAEEVLAKHDETYMPPEVQESLGISEKNKNKTIESIQQ